MTDETTLSGEMPAEAAAPLPETTEPVESATTPNTEPDQTSPEPDDAGGDKPRGGFQRRIDELTRNWREEQRRVDALTQALLQQRGQPPQPEAPQPAQPAKLPTLEEFGYDEAKYQAALIEYADKRASETVEKRFAEYERQRAEQARAETFVGRAREYAQANPDFMDVLQSPTLPISESVQDLAKDLENGPELIHWLVKNPQEADRLMRLPERLQAFEAGRIADRLESKKSAAKPAAPAAPVVTKAPPPPPTLEATEASGQKPPEEMTDDEWYRLQKRKANLKQFKKKA